MKLNKGVVLQDHMHIEYCPSQDISSIVKKLKGRTSRKLQQEFLILKNKYCGRHFWVIGYGCWSTGNITDKMVNEYLEHHLKSNNDNFILERFHTADFSQILTNLWTFSPWWFSQNL